MKQQYLYTLCTANPAIRTRGTGYEYVKSVWNTLIERFPDVSATLHREPIEKKSGQILISEMGYFDGTKWVNQYCELPKTAI